MGEYKENTYPCRWNTRSWLRFNWGIFSGERKGILKYYGIFLFHVTNFFDTFLAVGQYFNKTPFLSRNLGLLKWQYFVLLNFGSYLRKLHYTSLIRWRIYYKIFFLMPVLIHFNLKYWKIIKHEKKWLILLKADIKNLWFDMLHVEQ